MEVVPPDVEVVLPDADVGVAVPPDTTRVTETTLICPPMAILTVPLYVPPAMPDAFTLTVIWSFSLEMVPVDGLTVIHDVLPEAVQLLVTMEFLLNVIVCGDGVGALVDAL